MTTDWQNRFDTNLDRVGERLHSIDKTLVRQEANLREHMQRTRVAEKRLVTFEKKVEADLEPIKAHVTGMNYLLKAVGVLSLLLSVAFTALKLTESFATKGKTHEKVPEVRVPARPKGG